MTKPAAPQSRGNRQFGCRGFACVSVSPPKAPWIRVNQHVHSTEIVARGIVGAQLFHGVTRQFDVIVVVDVLVVATLVAASASVRNALVDKADTTLHTRKGLERTVASRCPQRCQKQNLFLPVTSHMLSFGFPEAQF